MRKARACGKVVPPVSKDHHPAGEPERFLNCPTCNAVAAKEETLGRTVVYVICGACGERWTISERRKSGREPGRAPRFGPAGK